MRHIRWGDQDRYLGPFTYARSTTYKSYAVILHSGDEEDPKECYLRIAFGSHTFILALPSIVQPAKSWADTAQYHWSKPPHGYWKVTRCEYGVTYHEGHLNIAYGQQTNNSADERRWGCFLPWTQWRRVRHSLYDLEGVHFWTHAERVWTFQDPRYRNAELVRHTIEAACPTVTFAFADYDGEHLTATTRIEEREWHFGDGWFKWLSLFRKPKISRSLDIRFSGETGDRKGSWKGGTLGHGIELRPGESHEAAFRRYCERNKMTFIGAIPGPALPAEQRAQKQGV